MIACDEGGFTVEYRVFSAGGDGIWIIEVHTDLITLEPTSDLKPATPLGSGFGVKPLEDLKCDFDRMKVAFEKPVMTLLDFPGKGVCPECNSFKYRCDCGWD